MPSGLTVCEIGFRRRTNSVFPTQLARHFDGVPIPRDHMLDVERQAQVPVA